MWKHVESCGFKIVDHLSVKNQHLTSKDWQLEHQMSDLIKSGGSLSA